MSKYILPDNKKIREIKQIMYTFDDKIAYKDRQSAEYAAAIGTVCECGNEFEGKSYICCPECREKHSIERYLKLELIEWDEKTPLVIWETDTYFFNEDEIHYHCEDFDIKIQDLQLVVCKPNSPPTFDLDEFLYDVLPEDIGIDEYNDGIRSASEVEEIVNDWIKDVSPISWIGGNKRVILEDLKK